MTTRERLARLCLDLECNDGQPEAAALRLAVAVCDATEAASAAQCSGIGVCLTSDTEHDDECAVTLAADPLYRAVDAYRSGTP